MTKHYFFDLDETLIDTSELEPYRKTNEGRRFVAQHADAVDTRLYDSKLVRLVEDLHKKNLVTIVTNSPKDYAEALLIKHGFPQGLPVYANLKKPASQRLEKIVKRRTTKREAVLIGDTAVDVLSAHGCGIASVAVTWGDTSTRKQLERAEPTAIVDCTADLRQTLRLFYREELEYTERHDPENYEFFNPPNSDPEIEIIALGTYHPVDSEKFWTSDTSNMILRFKGAKDFTWKEIRRGARDLFFHKGEVKGLKRYMAVIKKCGDRVYEHVDAMQLSGTTQLVGAPNSAPEYCYKSDINRRVVRKVNRDLFSTDSKRRYVFRVFPREESHYGGGRSVASHVETMGVKGSSIDADNIIIFDDVSTSGAQLKAIAHVIRAHGYTGNLYGLCLGKTAIRY